MSRSAIMKAAFGLAAGALVSSMNVGCAKNSGFTKNLDLNVVVKGSDPAEMKAEKLAKASEALLSAQGFAYASDVADLALQIDGNNLRAQFVKALLAPIMPMKGITARVAPLAQQNAKLKAEYDQSVAQMNEEMPNSTFKSFLLDGKADVQTESDAQAHLDEVTAGFDTLRRFARDNKDKELTVLPTDAFYHAMKSRAAACEIEKSNGLEFTISCPDKTREMEVVLARADFEMIQQYAAGLELYSALLNSYDLSGALKVAEAHADKSSPKAEQVINELLANPKFGQLRLRNGFRLVKELGPDAISGIRWVLANEDTLCKKGDMSPINRPGHLIDHGICLTAQQKADLPASLDQVEKVLAGANYVVKSDDGKDFVTISPMALVHQPISNVRSLTPLKYDSCGHVVEVSNPKLNGFFVDKDLNVILQGQKNCAN